MWNKGIRRLCYSGPVLWILISCGGDVTDPQPDPDPGPDPKPDPVVAAEVVVSPDTVGLWFIGDTIRLVATALDSTGTELSGATFVWSSGDHGVATVTASGQVAAVGVGQTTVFATADGIAGEARLTVLNGEIIEALIGATFLTWWSGSYWGNPAVALSAAADELTLSWGDYGARQLSSEPRVAWPNEPGFQYAEVNEDPWYAMYTALSATRDALDLIESGFDAGAPGHGRITRAIAFARLVQGMSHAWLGLLFDRGYIFDETVDPQVDSLDIVGYADVFAAGVAALEASIAIADTATFDLPSSWINGTTLSSAELSQVAHTLLARWLPQVARTPADRDAVDWDAVLFHTDRAISQDVPVLGDGGYSWWHALLWYGNNPGSTWARADYKTVGWPEAGSGKQYDTWLAVPVFDRLPFQLDVDDRRVTPGAPPHTATVSCGSDFCYWFPTGMVASRGTYHWSDYTHVRYLDWRNNGGVGWMPFLTTTEIALIRAEALLRVSGPSQAVADLINETRVGRGSMPPALAVDDARALMNQIVYEKRIEGFAACAGCAFFDRRGWGSLAPSGPTHHQGHVEGTALHFPIPGAELETLGIPIYTFGGVGNELVPTAVGPPTPASTPARLLYRFVPDATPEQKLELLVRTGRAPASDRW